MRYVPICDGELASSGTLGPKCLGQWLLNIDASGIPGAFDISVLDPASLASAFGAGFLLVGTVLIVAIPARLIVDQIRRQWPFS